MRSIPEPLLAHLQGDVTTLATCWRIVRNDGEVITSTDHDRPITLTNSVPLKGLEGVYQAATGITGSVVRSADDLSPDNLEVTGQTGNEGVFIHLEPADIEAGLLDDARIVLFQLNWQVPDDGQIILRVGNLGNIRRNTDGQYQAELRGLTQRLSQITVRTFGVACDAELGDARCGVDLALYRVDGEVLDVTSRRRITVELFEGSPPFERGFYQRGVLTFTSGDNQGFSREIKTTALTGAEMWDFYEVFPRSIAVGDTFEVTPGCDKRHAIDPDTSELLGHCGVRYDNVANFRGHGWLMPGEDKVFSIIDSRSGGGGGGKK